MNRSSCEARLRQMVAEMAEEIAVSAMDRFEEVNNDGFEDDSRLPKILVTVAVAQVASDFAPLNSGDKAIVAALSEIAAPPF